HRREDLVARRGQQSRGEFVSTPSQGRCSISRLQELLILQLLTHWRDVHVQLKEVSYFETVPARGRRSTTCSIDLTSKIRRKQQFKQHPRAHSIFVNGK